jgi:hypothetical protein
MTVKKQWQLPKWPKQPNQYRLKNFYQLYYLIEDDLPYMTEILILDAINHHQTVVLSSLETKEMNPDMLVEAKQ